jgi:hypothetical protein
LVTGKIAIRLPVNRHLVIGVFCALLCTTGHDTVSGQSPHPTQSRIAPVTVGKAPDIAGVVKGGTPYERILTGFDGLDDPIGIRDGTVLFSEPGARRINQLHPDGRVTILVADSNESHGITQDGKNRLITAQAWDGSTRMTTARTWRSPGRANARSTSREPGRSTACR